MRLAMRAVRLRVGENEHRVWGWRPGNPQGFTLNPRDSVAPRSGSEPGKEMPNLLRERAGAPGQVLKRSEFEAGRLGWVREGAMPWLEPNQRNPVKVRILHPSANISRTEHPQHLQI